MRKDIRRHNGATADENKTSTRLTPPTVAVTAAAPQARAGLCGYVVAAGMAPFCDRPVLPGGSYCAAHRALCAVAPASPEFAALAAAQIRAGDVVVAPPPELAWLRAPAPPERLDESDDEALAGLDLPPAEISHDE
jgi:hypothetical protein